jgi:hypothetical protein
MRCFDHLIRGLCVLSLGICWSACADDVNPPTAEWRFGERDGSSSADLGSLDDMPDMIKSSRFIPFIQSSSQAVLSVLPQQVHSYIDEQQQKLHSKKSQQGSAANGQNVIDQGIDAVTQKATEIANKAVQNSVKAAINGQMTQQQIQNAKAQAQQQADNLARLQPRVVPNNSQQSDDASGVTAKQEKALDKLLNTTTIDEQSADASAPQVGQATQQAQAPTPQAKPAAPSM